MHCNLHCVVVRSGGGGLYSRAMTHILNACFHCIVTCTVGGGGGRFHLGMHVVAIIL